MKMANILIWIFIASVIGIGSVKAFGESQSTSKYDNQVSKYDIGLSSFSYSYNGGTDCEEISFKEKEAIVADIKSGRFKIKIESGKSSGAIYHLSNDFGTQKEYTYFGERRTCIKYNQKEIIEQIKNQEFEETHSINLRRNY